MGLSQAGTTPSCLIKTLKFEVDFSGRWFLVMLHKLEAKKLTHLLKKKKKCSCVTHDGGHI